MKKYNKFNNYLISKSIILQSFQKSYHQTLVHCCYVSRRSSCLRPACYPSCLYPPHCPCCLRYSLFLFLLIFTIEKITLRHTPILILHEPFEFHLRRYASLKLIVCFLILYRLTAINLSKCCSWLWLKIRNAGNLPAVIIVKGFIFHR